MKVTVLRPVEVEIDSIQIILPVNYGDQDMPYDTPHRAGQTFSIRVAIDTGQVLDWPEDRPLDLYMKVVDGGTYRLLDANGSEVAALEQEYVPGVVPGEYGDYVDLWIDKHGVITNWPKKPDVSEFFKTDEE